MKFFILICSGAIIFPAMSLAQILPTGRSLKDPLSSASVEQLAVDKKCEAVKILDTNLFVVSQILDLSDWPACLSEGDQWKRVIEAKRLSFKDKQWVSLRLCSSGKDKGKKLSHTQFCDYLPVDDCPSCLLEKYKSSAGEEEGFRLWAKAVAKNHQKMVARRKFIKTHILKEK